MVEYNDALKKYFSYKAKYDATYNKQKSSIIKSEDLSRKEKRRRIEAIRVKCIGCKRNVNTIFSDKDRTYSAVCGDTDQPCGLDIQLKKSDTMSTILDTTEQWNEMQNIKGDIIAAKLNLLFGLIDEETLVTTFGELKQKYKESEEYLKILGSIGESDVKERDERVELLTHDLYSQMQEQKALVNEYLETGEIEKLTQAIELYIEELRPIEKEIADNKYEYRYMEHCVDDKSNSQHCLVQDKKTLSSYQIEFDEPEVVSFVIPKQL